MLARFSMQFKKLIFLKRKIKCYILREVESVCARKSSTRSQERKVLADTPWSQRLVVKYVAISSRFPALFR